MPQKQSTFGIRSFLDEHFPAQSYNHTTVQDFKNLFPDLLSNAASANDEQTLRKLLAMGADVNALNNYGCNALRIAAEKNNLKATEILIAAGTDVNSTDPEGGCTALWDAACHGHFGVVDKLIKAGASVNQLSDRQFPETALHTVIGLSPLQEHTYFRKDMVAALLSAGADVNIKDHAGLNALQIAIKGYCEVNDYVSKLRQPGAKSYIGTVKLLLDANATVDEKMIEQVMRSNSPHGKEMLDLLMSKFSYTNQYRPGI